MNSVSNKKTQENTGEHRRTKESRKAFCLVKEMLFSIKERSSNYNEQWFICILFKECLEPAAVETTFPRLLLKEFKPNETMTTETKWKQRKEKSTKGNT